MDQKSWKKVYYYIFFVKKCQWRKKVLRKGSLNVSFVSAKQLLHAVSNLNIDDFLVQKDISSLFKRRTARTPISTSI
jgi:hypothetical protein